LAEKKEGFEKKGSLKKKPEEREKKRVPAEEGTEPIARIA